MPDPQTPASPGDALAFATTLADMLAAAELGPVEWAGPINDPAAWLAGNQRYTDEHGDSGLPGYCVQSAGRSGEGDGIIVAFTGTGPHAAAYAELIAFLVNNAAEVAQRLAAPAQPAPTGLLTARGILESIQRVSSDPGSRHAAGMALAALASDSVGEESHAR